MRAPKPNGQAGEWTDTESTYKRHRLDVPLDNAPDVDVDLDGVAQNRASGKVHPGLQRSLAYVGLMGNCGWVDYRDPQVNEIRHPSLSSKSGYSLPGARPAHVDGESSGRA